MQSRVCCSLNSYLARSRADASVPSSLDFFSTLLNGTVLAKDPKNSNAIGRLSTALQIL